MTKLITIVTGSVRPNSAGKNIASTVKKLVDQRELKTQVVELSELDMPFFDSAINPAQPGYKIEYESVQKWQSIVQDSDGILFLTPEYNHQMSPVQLNAIDWLYADWKNKPAGIINYGFSGAPNSGRLSHDMFKFVGMRVVDETANLSFGEGDVELDGSTKNEQTVNQKIGSVIDGLVNLVDNEPEAES